MPMAPLPVKLWTWTGLYMGGHFGGGWGDAAVTDPAGAAIYGNNVRSNAVFAGVQAGYNWQVPNTFFVLGVDADVSAIGANGSGTCLASSGYFISANCRTRPDLGGTFTGRAGYAIGPGRPHADLRQGRSRLARRPYRRHHERTLSAANDQLSTACAGAGPPAAGSSVR